MAGVYWRTSDSLLGPVRICVEDGLTRKRGARCVGGGVRYLTARESTWEWNGPPLIVNSMWIANG